MFNKLIVSLCYKLPFLTNYFLRGRGFIFMLHRVLPKEERGYDWNKSLAISPEGIKKWVIYFRSKGFEMVSMDEALVRIKTKSSKKFIVFTMDDGYKDNLSYGLPILKKLNVPCTIYLSNCFPNNKAIYWWYFLEDYLKQNSEIDLRPIGINYSKSYTLNEGLTIYNEIRDVLRKASYEIHLEFAQKVCSISNLKDINKVLNLTWDEVKVLSNDPLITIGGHTVHHVSLRNQAKEVIAEEILEGTNELSNHLKIPIKHFAYPYGSKDDFSIELISFLEKSKYETAVINHPGSILSNSKTSLFSLPRMGLTDETPLERINDLFSGKVHLNFNGISKEYM
jgi:peptidoglycan/xylan/chitin deacetylase (PgdA/CDA1 family)